MLHDVFVSYSSKDKPTADAVCAVLESHGIRRWVAPRDILPGNDWGGSIIEAINGARAMVLVFSANANASAQIKREVERAVNKGIPVIPLRIEDVAPTATLEYFISTPHWLDAFTPPLDRHLQYLAEVARKIVGGPEVNSAAVAEREAREKFEAEAARMMEEKCKATELAKLKLAKEKRTAEAAEAARSAEEAGTSVVAGPDSLMPRRLKILGHVNVFVGPLVALVNAVIAVSIPHHTGQFGSLPELGSVMFCALGALVLIGSLGLVKEKRWGRAWSLVFAFGSFAPSLVFAIWASEKEIGVRSYFRLGQMVAYGADLWLWFSLYGILFVVMLNSPAVKAWAGKVKTTPSSLPVRQRPTSDLAIVSFICSLIPFFLLGQITGLILDILAIIEIKKSQGAPGGKNLALAGVLISSLILILMPGLFVLLRAAFA